MNISFSSLLDPIVSMTILCIALVVYIIILDEEKMFSKKFLHFGPGTDSTNTTSFMGISLDNWKKTIAVYSISFFTTLLLTFYNSSVVLYINSFIRNPAVAKLDHKKHHLTVFLVLEIFVLFTFNVLSIFTVMTGQLQFLLPSLIAYFVIRLPTNLTYLNKKIFNEK